MIRFRIWKPNSANGYWTSKSPTASAHALIRSTSRSSRASNSAGLEQNADGSVAIYFAPEPPGGKESNWVPTGGRDFEVLFRVYGPEKSFFHTTWKLPDMEPLHSKTL